MDQIYNFVVQSVEKNEDDKLPTLEIIFNIAQNYSEVKHYLKAIKLLEILLKLNDEDLEYWYLLAFNHFTINNFKYAMKCLKHFKVVSDKTSHKTDVVMECEDAAKELYIELEKIKANNGGELKNNKIEESEEDDEEERMMNTSNEMNID